jgi:hypothetical protein
VRRSLQAAHEEIWAVRRCHQGPARLEVTRELMSQLAGEWGMQEGFGLINEYGAIVAREDGEGWSTSNRDWRRR